MEKKNEITIPVTSANLIASLLESAKRHFYKNNKYISAFEAEKAAEYIREKVKEIT